MLVWVTGISGAGKSTACSALKECGLSAFDADFDGFNSWMHRATGRRVPEPPYPVPSGWTDDYAWVIDAAMVEELARTSRSVVTYRAIILDATQPPERVVAQLLAIAAG